MDSKNELLGIMDEREKRYNERHAALEKSFLLAMSSADKAVQKAETASERRFDSVNEFRSTLADQQRTLIPRAEVEVLINSINERISDLKQQLDTLKAERQGIKGGWGYAVGVVGLVLVILSIMRFMVK